MNLVDKFLAINDQNWCWANYPKMFYLWGHSYEFDNDGNWNILEEFCQKIGGHEDIWYATNMEIYKYVLAFDRLIYSAEDKYIENPSAIDVYINYSGKDLIIHAGETVEL